MSAARRASALVTRALAVLAALAVAFAAATWWALESGGVAVVETRAAHGAVRFTHVWYAEADGELWLEAGTHGNGWFQDIQQNPVLVLRADGRAVPYVARPVSDPTARRPPARASGGARLAVASTSVAS